MAAPDLEVLPDPDSVAARAATLVAELARGAVADHGRFTFAVSGGKTPWAMFAELATLDVPWDRVTIFQVDERVAPAGDPDRNLTHLRASLPAHADADIRPMPVEEADLDAAAARYAATLPAAFDLVHLGLGPDGHTASLIPGDPVLDVEDRLVALTGVYQGRRRMTLTYPALASARTTLFLITGADKAGPLTKLLAHDPSIPAGRVVGTDLRIVADAAAAPSA
jgi:6-phosphogluconolactonase